MFKVRLCTQLSSGGAVVVDSESEVVVASAVVVASELAMEEATFVLSEEDVASVTEVST